jgi:hypothetical protein
MSDEARDAVAGILAVATEAGPASIDFFAEMLAIVAIRLHLPKHRVVEVFSDFYDAERSNAKLPQ